GSLSNLALDAVAHHQESGRGLADLGRTFELEALDIAALAEALRRLGEAAQRAHLIAHEERRDAEEDDRGAEHPQHEDVGGRAVKSLARDAHLEDAILQLDRDEDAVQIAPQIEAIGPVDPLVERRDQRRHDDAVALLRAIVAQGLSGLEGEVELSHAASRGE